MRTFKFKVSKVTQGPMALGDFLLQTTKFSREELINAAAKGALWLEKAKGKMLRERSLNVKVNPEDTVTLFYDTKVLELPALKEAQCLYENERYGIWVKDTGVMPQGTQTGDHTSLLRFIELKKKKNIFLVHRLDRETAGLMVFAYDSQTAGRLSELFQKNQVRKIYQAIVLGEIETGSEATIDVALDDKKAITHYRVLKNRNGKSLLSVEIETGRLHQIRRHLDHIGHPVMGDPKYGRGNKNREGLMLIAKSLSFIDPWDKKQKEWSGDFSLDL
jgi:tRNA pseudouridine32 synthase / 23S rRNA pseudouridine746 synthase